MPISQLEPPLDEPGDRGFRPTRFEPAVWVSRLLVLRERRLDAVISAVHLRRGLNILWAPNHAGKTTFCRLLRYLLGEPRFAVPRAQDHIRTGRLRDGWVLGEVFVNGERWVVGRPFALHVHPFAARGVSLEEAIERGGGFQDFLDALSEATVRRLPGNLLPVTARPIDWPLLLTWLTRDQEARFSAVEEWRSPIPPMVDRSAVMRAVLNLISEDEAALQRQWEELDRARDEIDKEAVVAPFRVADRRSQLAEKLSISADLLADGSLFLQAAAAEVEQRRRQIAASRAKCLELAAEASAAAAAKEDAAREHAELNGRLKALIEIRDAQNRRRQQWLASSREAANADSTPALVRENDWRLAYVAGIEADIAATEAAIVHAREVLRGKEDALSRQSRSLVEAQVRSAATESAVREAEDLLARARAAELEEAVVEDLRRAHAAKMSEVSEKIAFHRRAHTEFRNRLSARFDSVLRALLGDQVRGRVDVTRHGVEPVVIPHGDRESAALDTIAVLAFDLAALTLGSEGHGHFPGFLIHDSPRVADMDLAIYERLFLYAKRLEEAFPSAGSIGFQYIITTATPPPKSMQRAPWLLDRIRDLTEEWRRVNKAILAVRGSALPREEREALERAIGELPEGMSRHLWTSIDVLHGADRQQVDAVALGHDAVYVLQLLRRPSATVHLEPEATQAATRTHAVRLLLRHEIGRDIPTVPLLVARGEIAPVPERSLAVRASADVWRVSVTDLPTILLRGLGAIAPEAPQREPLDSRTTLEVSGLLGRVPARVRPGRGGMFDELRWLQRELVFDLTEQSDLAEVRAALEAEHRQGVDGRLTSASFDEWRRVRVAEAAAEWIVTAVFVRALEERGLTEERLGPGEVDPVSAATASEQLDAAIEAVARTSAGAAVLGERWSPPCGLSLSASGAAALVGLFRARDGKDRPLVRLADEGDRVWALLYQELAPSSTETSTLITTPDFIGDLMLDLSLSAAMSEWGHGGVRVLDPACGIGDFLTRAFGRFCGAGLSPLAALERLHGVDLSPVATRIARARLILAFTERTRVSRLDELPPLPLSVAIGDALLGGRSDRASDGGDQVASEAESILARRYEVVVGEPPFARARDEVSRRRYRELYASASGSIELAALFVERGFELAVRGGFVAMLVPTSIVKLQIGRPLVEDVLARRDLSFVLDLSGAHVPGHRIPVMVLAGRSRPPSSETVRVVVSKRSEPIEPIVPADGVVWRSISSHYHQAGYEDDFIFVLDEAGSRLAKHPWLLRPAIESGIVLALSRDANPLGESTAVHGGAQSGIDDVLVLRRELTERLALEPHVLRPYIKGSSIHDLTVSSDVMALAPYDVESGRLLAPDPSSRWWKWLSAYRTHLMSRASTREQPPGVFWGWRHFPPPKAPMLRLAMPVVARFPEVALLGPDVVPGARVWTLWPREGAGDDEAFALLGHVSSSAACFWLKLHSFERAGSPPSLGAHETPYHQFLASTLAGLPLPSSLFNPGAGRDALVTLGRHLHETAHERAACSPERVLSRWDRRSHGSLSQDLGEAEMRERALLRRMVCDQEDLDWLVYEALGLVQSVSRRTPGTALPSHRPFAWMSDDAPAGMDRRLVDVWRARRTALRTIPALGALERPAYKRPFKDMDTTEPRPDDAVEGDLEGPMATDVSPFPRRVPDSYAQRTLTACEEWLLDRMEDAFRALPAPRPLSLEDLRVQLQARPGAPAVLQLLGERLRGIHVAARLRSLVEENAVPLVDEARYSASGLQKRREWMRAWERELRQAADASAEFSAPRQYEPPDFRDAISWRLRGKLDVPRERFLRFPGSTLAGQRYGWAGWDEAERAHAMRAG